MPSMLRRSLTIASIMVCVVAAWARAEIPPDAASPHLRPETAEGRALVAELFERSPTARALLDELNRSDLIVYVRFRMFRSSRLGGRVGLLAAAGPTRFLIVELACGRVRATQLATLAHELQHVVEIAREPSIVDAASLAVHYAKIGEIVQDLPDHVGFETDAARLVGIRVLRELSATARTILTSDVDNFAIETVRSRRRAAWWPFSKSENGPRTSHDRD